MIKIINRTTVWHVACLLSAVLLLSLTWHIVSAQENATDGVESIPLASADEVEAATEDATELALENLVAPASQDLIIPSEADNTTGSQCTKEAIEKGECFECLGSDKISPSSKEAKREKEIDDASGGKRQCYLLRTGDWNGGNSTEEDALPLQTFSQDPDNALASNPFVSNPGLSTVNLQDPALLQTLSNLLTQLTALQQLASLVGLRDTSGISQALSGLSAILSSISSLTNTAYQDQFGNSVADPNNSNVDASYAVYELNGRARGVSLENVSSKTIAVLLYVQELVDHDLIVTSAHRSQDYNASVGGASRSQHLDGNALDLSLAGLSANQKVALVEAILSHPDVRGFGYYTTSNSVHFDTRVARTGKGYWGSNYSASGFEAAATAGLIDPQIAAVVYRWSSGDSVFSF